MARASKKKKVVVVEALEAPTDFLPIDSIKPVFEQASHVVSHSDVYLFFDSKIGEVSGFVQRHDRNVGGEVLDGNDITFLSTDYKYLNNVTHFKQL
jgi:hypothetical protein